MSYEIVKTEYAYGSFHGVDYGSKIRIVMRSSEAILFVGYGLNIDTRAYRGSSGSKKIADKAKRELVEMPKVREIIIRYFGDGADEAALAALATRGMGTVLFNGGGDPLPLPRVEQSKAHREAYSAITPTAHVKFPEVKTCIQCGTPLRLSTVHHHLEDIPKEGHPKTMDECQRMTNFPVSAVHGFGSEKPREWWPYISWFETWDGESYVTEPFCNDRCAAIYGRRAAAELQHLPMGGQAPTISLRGFESIDHRAPQEPLYTESGIRIR